MRTIRIPATALAAAAQLAWATSAIAQTMQAAGKSTADQVAQYATDKLTTELKLTADQVPKVQKINAATAKQLETLIDKYSNDTTAAADAAVVRGYANAMRTNRAEMKKVLTPAQWTMHQQNRAERLAASQTEYMAYDLDLSKEQLPEVAKVNLVSANQLVTALDNVPGAKPTPKARVDAAKPVLDARETSLEKVLTVDQFKKIQANRKALQDLVLQEATTASASAAAPKPKP